MRLGNVFGRACVSVSVSLVLVGPTVTFESLDLKLQLWSAGSS